MRRLVADTLDEFGQLDCLVNSAGMLFRGDATEADDEDWRGTLATNLDMPFYLSRATLPHLVESKGSIVTSPARAACVPGAAASHMRPARRR